MAKKVVLDAGHGGYEIGSSYQDRLEKDDNLRLTNEIEKRLKDKGYEVYHIRRDDVFESPEERTRMSNDADADLLVSIHRNTALTPNTYFGAEAHIPGDGGLKREIAATILDNLTTVGFQNLGVNTMSQDTLLKNSQIPSVMLEVGFINSDEDNQLYDKKINEIAQAIATGIEQVLTGIVNQYPDTYMIQVGGMANEEISRRLAYRLFQDGYEAKIKKSGKLYVVHVGELYDLDKAVMLEQQLKVNGYNTLLRSETNE